jgi:hypothetical protein
MHIKTSIISIIALGVIILGIFSTVVSHENIVIAKKSSSSSKSLQQIPSNSTDFPSPEDVSTITLTFLKPSKDVVGAYHINGELKNTGNESLSFVQIKSHFYDKNMNIVAIESGFTNPINLEPGQTGDFDVLLLKDKYGSTPPAFFKLSYDWQ